MHLTGHMVPSLAGVIEWALDRPECRSCHPGFCEPSLGDANMSRLLPSTTALPAAFVHPNWGHVYNHAFDRPDQTYAG